MKRWIHAATDTQSQPSDTQEYNIWYNVRDKIRRMEVPDKFYHSSVEVQGLGRDVLEFRLYNSGRGYKPSLHINSYGKYEGHTIEDYDYEEILDEFARLFSRYFEERESWKHQDFSDRDIHEMMYM